MPYFVLADLNNTVDPAVVLRLLDDDKDSSADAAVLADLQVKVRDELRGYISRRYDLAALEASPPTSLTSLACEVAIQFAYQRRPELTNERGETPWEGRYRSALRRLGELRDGRWRLDVDGASPADPANVRCHVDFGPSDASPMGVGGGVFAAGFGDF